MLSVTGNLFAQNAPSTSDDLTSRLANLQGMTDDQLTSLYQSYHAHSEAEVAVLFRQLESKDVQAQYKAAFLLGATRSPSAVIPLASAILLEDTNRDKQSHGRIWFWVRYPAAQALIEIGKPSERPMIDNLASSDDPKITYLSLWVISAIERDDLVTEAVLKEAINRETNAERKARLQSTLSGLVSESSNFDYLRELSTKLKQP